MSKEIRMERSRLLCGGLVMGALLVPVLRADAVVPSIPLSHAPVERLDVRLWELSAPPKGETVLAQTNLTQALDGLFLGGEGKYGPRYGVELKNAIPVVAGSRCELAFEGRVADVASTFVVYVQALDAARKNVSDNVGAPDGWSHSPYTHAFYKLAIKLDRKDVWQRKVLPFVVPEWVSAIRVTVAPWRGTGVFCRAIDVKMKHGPVQHAVAFDRQEVASGGVRTFTSTADQLCLTMRSNIQPGGVVDLAATVADCSHPPRPRALRLQVAAPKDLRGWTGHRNWRTDERIEGTTLLRDEQGVGGHPVSRYPFTAVSKNGEGFAFGMPIDEVAYESRVAGTNGIVSSVAVGLLARPTGGTSATYRWQLFPFKGAWGFRSAARAYYALHGDKLRTPPVGTKEGTWLWPVWPSKAPEHPEDFGLTFWEAPSTIAKRPREIDAAHARGIEVFPYTEAWGMRQALKTAPDGSLPPVEARLAELQSWAKTNESGKVWFDAPRNVAAQAALNSLPVKPDGGHPFVVDRWDHWTHWWRTNSDPRLAPPNRASLCWDYTIGLDVDRVDGVYLDSVSYGFSVDFRNVRPDHLAVMDEPLIYDPETAQPCADGMQHQVAFVRWIADRLHAKNKRVFGNVFAIAHRFHATTIDIFGSEVGGWGKPEGEKRFQETRSDVEAGEKRFYAYHRPVADLLQEGFYEHVTPEFSATAMTNYVARQLFYGFYPGVSTIGGEEKPGYANWRRYFDSTRRCERDRDLFKVAVPLVRRLNKVGWQPEAGVRSSDARVWIERFGDPTGDCLITVRNMSANDVETVLALDWKDRALVPVWQGSPTPVSAERDWKIKMAPWQTAVYEVRPLPTGCPDFTVERPRAKNGPVLKAVDFGLSAATSNNAAAITAVLREAKRVGARRVELAAGTYFCHDAQGVVMEGLEDVEIDGKGATLVFYRPSNFYDQPQWVNEHAGANFLLKDCHRVRLVNLDLDWDWEVDPLGAFVTVVETHQGAKGTFDSSLDLEFVDYARHPLYGRSLPVQTLYAADASRDCMRVGDNNYFGQSEGHFGCKMTWLAPNRIRIWPGVRSDCGPYSTQYVDRLKAETNYRSVKMRNVGDFLRLAHYYYGKNCFVVENGGHVSFGNVNILSCRGMGWVFDGTVHHVEVKGGNVLPPHRLGKAAKGPVKRPLTTTADVVHVSHGSQGYFKFEDYAAAMNQDDLYNFHDRSSWAAKTGPKELTITQKRGMRYFNPSVGDELELLGKDYSTTGFRTKIERIDGERMVVDREVPERFRESGIVFNRTRNTSHVIIRKCVHEGPTGRCCILAPDVTIDGLVIRHSQGQALKIQSGTTTDKWSEGYGATNVVARNCVFEDVNMRGAAMYGVTSDVFVGVNYENGKDTGVKPVASLVSGILLENNVYIRPRKEVMYVRGASDIYERGNRIIRE